MEKEILINTTNKNELLWDVLGVYKALKQTALYKKLGRDDTERIHDLYMSLWWKLEIMAIIPDHINDLVQELYKEWYGLKKDYIKQGIKYQDYAHNLGDIRSQLLAWIDLSFFETKAFLDILASFSSFFIPLKSKSKKIREYFGKQVDHFKKNKELLPRYSNYLSKSMEWYDRLDKHRTKIAHFLAYDLKVVEKETDKMQALLVYVQNDKYNLHKNKTAVIRELYIITQGLWNFVKFYKGFFTEYLLGQMDKT